MSLFKVENLTYFYPESNTPALDNINLEIEEGDFILVIGGSGSGKSSLVRVLNGLIPDFYGGRIGGKVFFKGNDIGKMDRRKLCREIGMVFQDPEKQIVQTYAEAEIAFGLENLGLCPEEMLRRIAEVVSFMNLSPIMDSFTANLSGGQKQKLAVASVLAMQPHVLMLDEPTSQLDPVSAEEILNLVKRLNEEMGFTIIMIEQRLERCFHLADRVILLENGKIACDGKPQEVSHKIIKKNLPFIPPVARFFASLDFPSVPITVKEGRKLLHSFFNKDTSPDIKQEILTCKKTCSENLKERESIVSLKNLWFTYPDGQEVLKNVSLNIKEGEFLAIMGENGAGKSTLLKVLTGLLKPDRGSVQMFGKNIDKNSFKEIRKFTAYLSQNPNDYLFHDTIEEELLFTMKNFDLKDLSIIEEILETFHLVKYRSKNPWDLSSGERQRVALASVLVTKPRLIILDEPTRGIDLSLKKELGNFLHNETNKGTTVIVVTHDVEFAAEFAESIVMMFAGRIVSHGKKHEVMDTSIFYSSQIGKICRGIYDGVLSFKEAKDKIFPLLEQRLSSAEQKMEVNIR
ncbi:MAG: energy-coupling factor transporter ATPase [Thermoanaerobacteraceae bacterium]|nr:energy-coupling factor transporter ATPase [Thermoanaerobacteraceae bacterium]